MFTADLLADKVIFITGGGTGLGRSMGERFAQLGARLAIAGRRLPVLEQTAREIQEATGQEVLALACDVRQADQVEATVARVFEHFGRMDVLVNNAAGNFISPTERLSSRAVDSVLQIVLHGTFYCSLAVGKEWIARESGGTMLNIVTTYAASGAGSAFVAPSAAAKAGVLALTRSLAAEWGRHGIRQVAIAPGPFPTEGAWERLMPGGNMEEEMKEGIPLGRFGRHEELTNLAAYLLSDMAAYIHGEVITIDGGEWVQGAGEFNKLRALSNEQWDAIAAQAKAARA